MAPDYEVLEDQLQTANQRLSEARRGFQATEQALLDERTAHTNDAVVATAARIYVQKVLSGGGDVYPRQILELDELVNAHRATTPSSASATHVVIAVDELVELKRLKDDHYQAGYDDGWDAGIESAERE